MVDHLQPQDTTDNQTVEERLSSSEARFRQLLQANPVGIVLAAEDGRISEANDGFLNLVRYTRRDLEAGQINWQQMTPPQYADLDRRAWDELRSRGTCTPFEKEYIRKDGTRVPVLIGGSMLDASSCAAYVVDLSQQKLAETRLRFLAEISDLLGSSLEYEETLRRLCRGMVPTFADYCLVVDVDEDGTAHTSGAHADPQKEPLLEALIAKPLRSENSLAARALASGEPQLAETIPDEVLEAAAQDEEHLRVLRALGPRSSVFIPLVARERVLGVIGFAYAESGRQYRESDLEFAMEVGRRAALAVDNARLYRSALAAEQEALTQAARLEALSEASRAFVNAGLDLKGVLDTVTRRVAELVGDVAIVGLLTDDRTVLEAASVAHSDPERLALLRALQTIRRPATEGISGMAIQSGEPVLLSDLEQREAVQRSSPRYRDYIERYGCSSALAVPMRTATGTVGVWFLGRDGGRPGYTEADKAFLLELAARTAQAIENARLYQAEQALRHEAEVAARRTQRLQAVTAAFAQTFSANQVAHIAVDQGRQALGADAGWIALVDSEADTLRLAAAHGFAEEITDRWGDIPLSTSAAVCDVVKTGESQWYATLEELFEVYPGLRGGISEEYQGLGCVPLASDGQAAGVLCLSFHDEHQFAEADRQFIESVARLCGQALERARLHEEEQRARAAAEQSAERLAALQTSTAALVNAHLDLDAVLNQVAERVGKTIGDVCQISLIEDNLISGVATYHPDPEGQRLLAAAGGESRDPDTLGLGPVIAQKSPILVPNFQAPRVEDVQSPGFRAYLERFGAYSLILAPLLVGERVAGVVAATRLTADKPYNETDLDFFTQLTGTAAQAIERARLYKESERYAARLAALADASRAFSEAAIDMQRLVGLAVERVGTLVGEGAVLRLLSDDGQRHRQVAAYHPDPQIQSHLSELNDQWLSVDEGLTKIVAETGRPIFAPDVRPENLERMAGPYREAFERDPVRSLIVAPLYARGRLIGVLGVLRFTDRFPYTRDDESFVVDLGDRAALAIDNARLYEQRQSAQEQVTVRARRLQALARAALDISATLSLAEVLQLVTDRAREIVGAHQCVLTVADERSDQPAVTTSLSRKYAKVVDYQGVPRTSMLYRQATTEQRTIRLSEEDLSGHPGLEGEVPGPVAASPLRGWLAAPLMQRDGVTIGLIQLSDRYEGDFSEEDEFVLVQLAQMASTAIETARLFEQVERALATRNQFLSMASHELKTPITSVKGYSQVLLRRARREGDQTAVDVLTVIDGEADRMTRLINELLDVARIERGRLEFEIAPFILNEAVRESVSQIAMTAEDYVFNIQEEQNNLVVNGDRMRVEQVVTNLLEQRRQVLHGTQAGGRAGPGGRWQGHGICPRLRHRHTRRAAGRRIRALFPWLQPCQGSPRRHGAWPLHQPGHRRGAPRRDRRGHGRGRRQRFQRQTTAGFSGLRPGRLPCVHAGAAATIESNGRRLHSRPPRVRGWPALAANCRGGRRLPLAALEPGNARARLRLRTGLHHGRACGSCKARASNRYRRGPRCA